MWYVIKCRSNKLTGGPLGILALEQKSRFSVKKLSVFICQKTGPRGKPSGDLSPQYAVIN